MTSLYEEFKKIFKGERPDKNFFVPVFIWASGSEKNIKMCQTINKRFKFVDTSILINTLVYGNKLRFPIKYPTNDKKDKKVEFFLLDICNFYGWTKSELYKNWNVIDLEYLKTRIPKVYGYDKKEIRMLKKV